jgi:hypothetical protein
MGFQEFATYATDDKRRDSLRALVDTDSADMLAFHPQQWQVRCQAMVVVVLLCICLSLLLRTHTHTLIAVFVSQVDWFAFMATTALYLLLPLAALGWLLTRKSQFLPFNQQATEQPFRTLLSLLLLHFIVLGMPLAHLVLTYGFGSNALGVLSTQEWIMPLLYYCVVSLNRSFGSAVAFPGSEVASRLQKCTLDRTIVKLPYDQVRFV